MTTSQHRPLPDPATEPMTASRPGLEPREVSGRTAHWPDGVHTYTLAFHGGKQWQIADEADTAILAMDAIQSGEQLERKLIWEGLRDIRRLKQRLAAIEEELMLAAREPEADRDKMSFRELGEAIGQHHTTVKERYDRLAIEGRTHTYRRWLTENTPRADLYPTT
ncbi:hypothetical protein IOD14_43945 (plasmid) [Streptomyces sp. A2-16]|uniref:hypothetical protein n=1 Tax=Streptomyces sp. A2-16 TaxID=2781734 RepID=UPI001BB0A861|nr:hypothetical protein [Streptomyces sp. A2-16]QUC63802.1 hypothetical protein IOD14_43945 [Streptomyces sp. A2-16]